MDKKPAPYVEFRFSPDNKSITFTPCHTLWGDETDGFIASDGSHGNACKPSQLREYIDFYRNQLVLEAEQEIIEAQKKLDLVSNTIHLEAQIEAYIKQLTI